MSTIISNDNLKIMKDKRTQNLYTIEFSTNCESLIKSLIKTKIIIGATVFSNYKTLKFKATSIQTFSQFCENQNMLNNVKKMPIPIAANLLSNLARQLKYLITTHNESFIGYAPENIIVIDEEKFAYMSHDHLSYIEENKLLISFPFSQRDFFLSPEQIKITELPSYIHYKTAYYSLACLIIYSLSSDDDFLKDENDKPNHVKFNDQLYTLSIKSTKLYWLLKKSLLEDPKERSLLFI